RKPSEESMPVTPRGEVILSIASHRAPVPQPTSSHSSSAGAATQLGSGQIPTKTSVRSTARGLISICNFPDETRRRGAGFRPAFFNSLPQRGYVAFSAARHLHDGMLGVAAPIFVAHQDGESMRAWLEIVREPHGPDVR